MSDKKLSPNEPLKLNSDYLRGTLAEEIADTSNGSICADSQQLSKFHGMYLQDDRDVRAGRRKKKLDKAYSFLIQLHGVIKNNLKSSIQEMHKSAMDCIAACGDVNRNVICNANPHLSDVHSEAVQLANNISEHLLPSTRAYHEIFLDEEKVISSEEFVEPLYGKTYLPRKFKINVAVPPENDTDIYAQCLSFIAIVEDEKIVGYNVSVGGGMGMTHGVEETFPRTADVIGFVTPDKAVDVAEKVMLVQRDFGERGDRKFARLKYTVERMTAEGFRDKLEEYLGYKLEPVREFKFESNGDRFGWVKDDKGNHHLTLFIPGGRVLDTPSFPMKSGLVEIAKVLKGEFRMTANQNLV